MSVRPYVLPDQALLARYDDTRMPGSYTDCFAVEVAAQVPHAQFVAAFYTTWLFKIERAILRVAVSRPSTDAQANQLADGLIDRFAAWRVEDRAPDQLLMADMTGRTRSWLMVEPCTLDNVGVEPVAGTRLLFGSAVVAVQKRADAPRHLGFVFYALLGFHRIYSRLLLRTAVVKISRFR